MDEPRNPPAEPEKPVEHEVKKNKIQVRIVMGSPGNKVLVEWEDRGSLHRVTVPAVAVSQDGKVDQDVLQQGKPFGVQWADAGINRFTGKDLQNKLYRAGLWTYEDITRNPNGVIKVFRELYGLELAALLRYAREHREGGN